MLQGVIALVIIGVILDAYYHWRKISVDIDYHAREDIHDLTITIHTLEDDIDHFDKKVIELEKKIANLESML